MWDRYVLVRRIFARPRRPHCGVCDPSNNVRPTRKHHCNPDLNNHSWNHDHAVLILTHCPHHHGSHPQCKQPRGVPAKPGRGVRSSVPGPLSWRLQVLLSLLVLLLLLLGGSLFLAWRIVRKRVKAGENPKPLRTHSQNTLQGELYYANLELQTRTLQGEPVQPRQEEVEYSTVLCVERRGSVLCGSRKRCDPCRMVPLNIFINHSSVKVCGIATAWGALAERLGEGKGPDDRVFLVSETRTLSAHGSRAGGTFLWTLG
ncbi:CMRF35-like molecule 8 isoform X6 [Panthera onca]